jgi:hypothetical protein
MSWVVWRRAVSSSGLTLGTGDLGFGIIVGVVGAMEGRAEREDSDIREILKRVNSTKQRINSFCVARRVVNGKLRSRGSLLRSTALS